MSNSYTTFPDSVQTFDIKTDVSSGVYSAWKQFNTYISNGEFANASFLLQSSAELQKCIIDSVYVNRLSKTVEEIQTLFLNEVQTYIHETVVHKGEWNATTKYVKYNFVTFGVDGVSQTFECLRSDVPIGTPPTNTIYWVPRIIRGEKGASGFGLSPRGEWSAYVQYYKDDLVSYNNALWTANLDNFGYFPNDTSSIWTCALSMNIMYDSIKILNNEIDAIIDGTAVLTDGNTGTSANSDSSITQNEIDNVLLG